MFLQSMLCKDSYSSFGLAPDASISLLGLYRISRWHELGNENCMKSDMHSGSGSPIRRQMSNLEPRWRVQPTFLHCFAAQALRGSHPVPTGDGWTVAWHLLRDVLGDGWTVAWHLLRDVLRWSLMIRQQDTRIIICTEALHR